MQVGLHMLLVAVVHRGQRSTTQRPYGIPAKGIRAMGSRVTYGQITERFKARYPTSESALNNLNHAVSRRMNEYNRLENMRNYARYQHAMDIRLLVELES